MIKTDPLREWQGSFTTNEGGSSQCQQETGSDLAPYHTSFCSRLDSPQLMLTSADINQDAGPHRWKVVQSTLHPHKAAITYPLSGHERVQAQLKTVLC